jgi:hypothetical protein
MICHYYQIELGPFMLFNETVFLVLQRMSKALSEQKIV